MIARIFILLALLSHVAHGTAITSTANGNWSAGGTWVGGVAPGIGDTATIAHTVTVDVDTTIGTSPNDTTTNVVTLNTTKTLSIAAGKTLTVRGNIAAGFQSFWTMAAGSAVVFDNAASGGSPVYAFPANFCLFTINGTSGSHCAISAISGQTFTMSRSTLLDAATITYLDVTRMAASTWGLATSAAAKSITSCTFTSCGKITFDDNTTVFPFNFNDNSFVSTTGSTGAVTLNFASSAGASARNFLRNKVDAYITHFAKDFIISSNYLGGGINCTVGRYWAKFSLNFVRQDGTLNGGDGALFTASSERNYYVVENSSGNAHFLAPQAKGGVNNTISQSIFEGVCPDLVDLGDSMLVIGTAATSPQRVIGANNITLPLNYSGASASSGTLATLYNSGTTSATEWYRNTASVKLSSIGSTNRGMFEFAEGSSVGTIQVLKGNLAWASTASQGYLAERQAGNTKDLIVAAAADYNWTYNTSAGDNQRGYEDKAASNTIWTAGDAVAASVDTHQGTGDPQFYDSTRNLTVWVNARGYGTTYANALTALQAAPSTRIPDLIAYVFEGYRPGNTSCRNAAHDGGCVGAANFYKSTRTTANITAHRLTLSKFGI